MMTRHSIAVLALFLAGSLITPAMAQETFTGGPHKGARDISLFGSYTYYQGSATLGILGGQYGYFVNPRFEVGPSLLLVVESAGGGGTLTFAEPGVFAHYYLGHSKTVPYLNFDVARKVGSGVDFTSVGGGAGVLFFTAPHQSFFVELGMHEAFGGGASIFNTQVNIGLKLFLS